jgi:hypothetical protein
MEICLSEVFEEKFDLVQHLAYAFSRVCAEDAFDLCWGDDYCYLRAVGETVCRVDRSISDEEVEALEKLESLYNISPVSSAEEIKKEMTARARKEWEQIESVVFSKSDHFSACQRHAERVGAGYELALQRMYIAFASMMAGIRPSEAKRKFVQKYTEFIQNGADSNPQETPGFMEMPEGFDETGPMGNLFNLVGLAPVKAEVIGLVNLLRVNHMRSQRGMPQLPTGKHMVFSGNPGTGKTTVARLIAEIYADLGVLTSGHLVEADRSGLIAKYMGQTAVKVNEVVTRALGGVLFIDEAYSLVQHHDDSYGHEAIDTLLKLIEDHRSNLVVVVAGYPDKMAKFLDGNPGMKPDYSAKELCFVFENMAAAGGIALTRKAKTRMSEILRDAVETKDEAFGNARYVRNLFERAVVNQANRVSRVSNVTDSMLATLEATDIEAVASS